MMRRGQHIACIIEGGGGYMMWRGQHIGCIMEGGGGDGGVI